ncbi:MAG TPA: S-layer homology domain-containing protein [Candidatus Peribacteraceae bacterium]|nr:S-layer homology domain-containing protein [Candidatus Peribacteraceae bacterium]
MRTFRSLVLLAALLLPSLATVAEAASFSDVTSTSFYAPAIGALSDKGIIKGNPDGTFAPDKTVNRAEFLTMLYRSMNETPSAPSQPCFKDVPTGSWFEAVVCDAASKGYVSGYSDKTFKPQQPVNRVEALKMMFTVLGLSLQSTSTSTARASAYADVDASGWYMQYLSAALKLRVLPVPGTSATTFGPDQPLTRAEAAAFIYNATSPDPLPLDGSWPSSSSVSSASSQASSVTNQQTSSAASSAMGGTVTIRDFPFSDSGVFQKKYPQSYQFKISQTTVASISVTVADNNTQGDVTCRLFKLDGSTNFSLEYYLGYMGPDVCKMRVALAPGSYQLDVAPTIAGLTYNVFTKATTGDNNDGFSQAQNIQMNRPYTGLMDASDYGDFYTFKLSQQTQMTINLSNADKVKCVVYPMADVDIFGFSEPNCNQSYLFPAGTYYVGIMQKDGNWDKPSYTIQLSQ